MTQAAPPGTSLVPGRVIDGKYRVERVLAAGGMGLVAEATQLDLGRTVALKFMLPTLLTGPEALSRFLREARIVAGLRSEHVARVHDLGKLEDDIPYIAMEYLRGVDVGELLERHGALGFGAAAHCVRQACDGIAEAHAQGVVHRDLKPANLFLTTRHDGTPLVKVLDFGISRAPDTGASDDSLTRSDTVFGSPCYMSPEQMTHPRTVDLRTDVWSLGVILYELVAGEIPFVGETLADLALKVHHHKPEPLQRRRAGVPREYSELVMRCLEVDRERRFSSAAELAQARSKDSMRVRSRFVP